MKSHVKNQYLFKHPSKDLFYSRIQGWVGIDDAQRFESEAHIVTILKTLYDSCGNVRLHLTGRVVPIETTIVFGESTRLSPIKNKKLRQEQDITDIIQFHGLPSFVSYMYQRYHMNGGPTSSRNKFPFAALFSNSDISDFYKELSPKDKLEYFGEHRHSLAFYSGESARDIKLMLNMVGEKYPNFMYAGNCIGLKTKTQLLTFKLRFGLPFDMFDFEEIYTNWATLRTNSPLVQFDRVKHKANDLPTAKQIAEMNYGYV